MAIQCKITTIQGVNLELAYVNIQNPQIIKVKTEDGNRYTFGGNACVYVDQEAYDTGKPPIEGFSVVCDLDLESNPLTQAYEALKNNDRLENIVNLEDETVKLDDTTNQEEK